MTSILTNNGAISALQTLRSMAGQMGETQRLVSSGLRVGQASDNSAYWSIATTMRSDNLALSAVQDALGLGAAKVGTAYSGTNSIVDILSSFKARLVTATEDGVDRSKVQEELRQLNAQAESVVAASSFSGVNWLKTSEALHFAESGNLSSSVVSSFVRSADGAVSVKTLDVDLKATSMLNAGGGGILQKDIGGIGDMGGFANANMNIHAHNGHQTHEFTGPATFGATDYIEFSALIDAFDTDPGMTVTGIRIDKAAIDAALGTTDGVIGDALEMRQVLQHVFNQDDIPLWAVKPSGHTQFGSSATRFEIGSLEDSGHIGSSIDLFGVTSDFGGAYPAGFALGLENAPSAEHDNMFPKGTVSFTEPFQFYGDAEILFDVEVNGGGVQTLAINKETVDTVLGTTDGFINSLEDFTAVLAHVTAGSGVTVISTDWEYLGVAVFMADPAVYPEAGNKAAHFNVWNVRTNVPRTVDFDLAEVDITTDRFSIDKYIDGVELMLQQSISSASKLGALQARIDMQTTFATTLSDSIEQGVGRLVDADMNEASTRLKALQTQEQLAIQSLSIANSNADHIRSLFG